MQAARAGDSSASAGVDPGPTSRASASRIARNTFSQAAGAAVSYLATLGFFVVLARAFGGEDFGDFMLALSIGTLVGISALGTDYAITREVARGRERLHDVFWNSVAIRVCLGVIGITLAATGTWLAGYDADIVAATALIAASAMVAVLAQATQAALRGIEDMAPIGRAWVLQRVFTGVVGGAVALLGGGLIAVGAVYLAGSVLGLAYSGAVMLARQLKPRLRISWQRARPLLGTSIPLAVGNIMVLVLARLDIVILSGLKGNAAVGLYGAAYRLFEGTAFFSTLFGLSAYPALSRLDRRTQPTIAEAYEKGSKAIVVVLVPVGLCLVLFADPIIEALYGGEYSASASALRLLGPAIPLWGVFTFTLFVLAAVRRQRVIGWVLGGGVAANVALNLALIPPYSLDGAAAAMTLTLALIDCALIVPAIRSTGRIRPIRIAASAGSGLIAMAAVGLLWGTGVAQLPAGLVAYCVTMLAVERRFYGGDLAFMRRALRGGLGRGPASATTVDPTTGAGL